MKSLERIAVRYACSLALVGACGGSDIQGVQDAAVVRYDVGQVDAPVDSGVPMSISVTLKNQPTTPATFGFAVAYQDGAGAWQVPSPADTNDTFTFTVTSPTWAFAWMCATPTAGKLTPQVNIFGAAVAERTSYTQTIPAACTDRVVSPVTLTVDVTNLPATTTGTYYATFAGVTAAMTAGATGTGSFTIAVAPGTHDLVVGHNANTVTTGAGSADVLTDLTVVQRALDLTANQTVTVDFSQAIAPQSVVDTASVKITSTTTLVTANGTAVKLGSVSTSPYSSDELATSQGLASDVYVQQLSTAAAGAAAFVQAWAASPVAMTFTAPAALGTVTSSELSMTPYPIVQTSWPVYTDAIGYRWQATQPATGTATVAWTTQLTPGYVGGAPSYSMPDLSAIAGWSSSLGLVVGTPVSIRAIAMTSSLGAADFPFVAKPAVGTQRTQLTGIVTLTP